MEERKFRLGPRGRKAMRVAAALSLVVLSAVVLAVVPRVISAVKPVAPTAIPTETPAKSAELPPCVGDEGVDCFVTARGIGVRIESLSRQDWFIDNMNRSRPKPEEGKEFLILHFVLANGTSKSDLISWLEDASTHDVRLVDESGTRINPIYSYFENLDGEEKLGIAYVFVVKKDAKLTLVLPGGLTIDLGLVPARVSLSTEELIAERMTAQPVRDDCLYRKPEMINPSKELAQGPESDLVVSVTWHEDVTGRPYCGGAAVWRFDSEEKAEEKLQVQTAKLGDLEAGTCLSDACGKATVVRAGRWVIWVLVSGDTVEQAEEHLTDWLGGFLKDLHYLFG